MPKAPKEQSEDTYPFVKKLAANDRPTRDAALESLTKFLQSRRTFDLFDLQKLWKGLYFSMWFSDRPRTQQRLADDLAGLLDVVHETNFKLFYEAFWTIIAREWDGIDRHRIDKFYLLIRRYVAGAIRRVKSENWGEEWVSSVNDVHSKVPFNYENRKIPNALPLHMFDIFLDEIERVVKEGQDEEDEEIDWDELPIKQLIAPIQALAEHSPLKMIRTAAKTDLLDDSRLITWGVVQLPDEDDEDEDEDEDEWGGFD